MSFMNMNRLTIAELVKVVKTYHYQFKHCPFSSMKPTMQINGKIMKKLKRIDVTTLFHVCNVRAVETIDCIREFLDSAEF